MRVFGADEAGRGPVLGPMVAAAVRADPGVLPEAVADSKTLSPPTREALAAAMRANERIAIGVATVSPARIDDSSTDMNTLTVTAQADAISQVLRGVNSDAVCGVVDACDVDPERFARRVRAALGAPNGTDGTDSIGSTDAIDLHAEHRADETHAIVAAASVIAKVERDSSVAAIENEYESYDSIGSGYPSDPHTREFLAEYVRANGELPACARASWKTSRDVLAAADQSALADF